jgi:rare lipoprotein A
VKQTLAEAASVEISTSIYDKLMTQKLWNGLTAVLLTTAISTTSSCHAQQTKAVGENSAAGYGAIGSGNHLSAIPNQTGQKSLPPRGTSNGGAIANLAEQQSTPQNVAPRAGSNAQPAEAFKVGTYHTQAPTSGEETIAKIETHQIAGRKAAILYVRNIPLLTFVSPQSPSNQTESQTGSDAKIGQVQATVGQASTGSNPAEQQVSNNNTDPVWRAMAVAAKINQLSREGVNATTITVRWNGAPNNPKQVASDNSTNRRDRYIIQADGRDLVEIDADTRLPDTTRNLAQDALQATNRLRRLMGNAPPLREVAGIPAPRPPAPASLVTVLSSFRGIASWYGPGFHGNRSASGERFNQNELTAAHRHLPFGTQVRVTNLHNGRTVVVRINDRGPFIRGRIIDLSAAAAQMLGMMGSGVAPVTVEVLGRPQSVANDPS